MMWFLGSILLPWWVLNHSFIYLISDVLCCMIAYYLFRDKLVSINQQYDIVDLVQDCGIYIANALKILWSCTELLSHQDRYWKIGDVGAHADSIVVADSLVHIWCQVICNHHADADRWTSAKARRKWENYCCVIIVHRIGRNYVYKWFVVNMVIILTM